MNSLLLATLSEAGYAWFTALRIVMLVVMAVCAIFLVLVILLQPSNSSGVSAIQGQSETFLSKNKGKTKESKLKKLTVISFVVLGVLCVVYAILMLI